MGSVPVTLDFSKAQPIEKPVTLDFSKAQPLGPTPEQTLSRTNQNLALAMSGQQGQMSPEDLQQFEAGRQAGFGSAAATAATGAVGGALAAPSVTAGSVGTGILNAAGHEIMRDITQYGPSAARTILAHPIAQRLLIHAAGTVGAGAILKALGIFGK
jgi:hypothetical protein